MTWQCNKGHRDLKRSTSLIPGQTVNHCPECGSYNVEGSPWWPVGDLATNQSLQQQLCVYADYAQERANRWAEFLGAEPNDPRVAAGHFERY
jgi:hypothetical protein